VNDPTDREKDSTGGAEGELPFSGGRISEDGIVIGGDPALRGAVQAALKTCYDPEIPVDIYQLGLIYRVAIADSGDVAIDMTLTSPACPVAGTLPGEVERTVAAVAGVTSAKAEVVWDPPWGPEKMSEAARLQLGLF
jgi:FeS assembly SUF system protein